MQEARNLDCRVALERLVGRHPEIANESFLKGLLDEGCEEEGEVLAAAQKLLLRPQLTVSTAGCFRPVLSRLVDGLVQSLRHLWQQSAHLEVSASPYPAAIEEFSSNSWSLSTHEYAVMAFSRLLELAPYTLSILLQYFVFAPPPFERVLQAKASSAADVPPLLDVVRACYRLLQLEPKIFRDLWDWSPFLDLLQWTDQDNPGGPLSQECIDVRWSASQILSIVLRMSDGATRAMNQTISALSEEDGFACLLRWEAFGHEIAVEKAGMYLEPQFVAESAMVASSEEVDFPRGSPVGVEEFRSVVKRTYEGGASFVEVCGIELPVRQGQDSTSFAGSSMSSFVLTWTVKKNLESVVMALSQRQPILLEGPIGAGKTMLIQELADLTGNFDVVFIHLDDQMDSKTLLGNYVCTDIPGEFKWQPGALTQAVVRGLWVVFEDIDRAPMEILSAIVPLLEDRKLYIAGRGEVIHAAENFSLFATVTRTRFGSAHQVFSGGKDMLTNLWRKVVIDAPSDEELAMIIKVRFRMLSNLIAKLIGTLNMVREMTSQSSVLSDGAEAISVHIGRQFSSRDLVKWCKRIAVIGSQNFEGSFLSTYVRERIFVEAIDCFAGSISSMADRQLVMRGIAEQWQVPVERVDFFNRMNKPSLLVSTSSLQIGRATLTASTHKGKSHGGRVFAHTGHAMRMLESIGICVQQKEPVLLVGETGTGKTTIVQYLARQISMPLVVLNLSQQSDSVDLLGGYKPVEAQSVCIPLFESFNTLFRQTFPMKKNAHLLEQVGRWAERKRWDKLLKAFRTTIGTVAKLAGLSFAGNDPSGAALGMFSQVMSDMESVEQIPKRKRALNDKILDGWRTFSSQLQKAERQVESAKTAFAFSFVEGALVKALKEGHWILLDEINLAPTETLERLTGVLEGGKGSLCLTERGDVETIKWHPDFRIFACMNPATDVGKRDLPISLKNRFTEYFVDELTNKEDLHTFVYQYLETALPAPPVEDIVNFYLLARQEAEVRLLDGANQKPQYSLRSLARALEYAKAAMSVYGFQRSLYDGLCMSFLTLLDRPSSLVMEQLILGSVFKQTGPAGVKWLKSLLKVPLQPSTQHVLFEQFWVEKGDVEPSGSSLESCQRYVLTVSIREHLKNLARAVFVRKNPVLLQGPTSSGKTSMIEYLALTTGHRFVRINNHAHTDLQEYLGSYVTDNSGKLVFQEGILVEAVRNGYWIVLDELNLAPSDVLEALNRLLDDNRELFVPELQVMVKPHPHFMLFATQNPPGIYGGRKILSRAFRNRFIELHVDDIPDEELQVILEKRCQIPGSYASKMVEVMKDLQRHRQSSKAFAGKHGFITPRDLFRWADRHANGYQELARDGYMLLAERLRDPNEKVVVQRTLEKHMRVKIEVEELHEMSSSGRMKEVEECLTTPEYLATFGKIVWTKSMKRLFNLVEHCTRHSEPVLLVGETGCGKTTVCQMLALLLHHKLHILNCHQHSETADFIGGLRPVRERDNLTVRFEVTMKKLVSSSLFQNVTIGEVSSSIEESSSTLGLIRKTLIQIKSNHQRHKPQSNNSNQAEEITALEVLEKELLSLQREWQSLFVWHDGPLVEAMRNGDFFLIDEISLADDSVLERLNSVLEPKRLLVLAEKGGSSVEEIVADEKFRLLATMNPGGDFGKKELSPALRNRFTEIWVPPISDLEDLRNIVIDRFAQPELLSLTNPLLQFWQWFQQNGEQGRVLSVRDLLSWVSFINYTAADVGLTAAFVHGALLVLLDGLGLGTGLSSAATEQLRSRCLKHLLQQLPDGERDSLLATFHFRGETFKTNVRSCTLGEARPMEIEALGETGLENGLFGIHPFYVSKGTRNVQHVTFELSAPTTSWNALRILRAMQLSKPVLLEGSPGVGKTSLVTALAMSSGHPLVRINLSEQTDVMDLFGSDMPVEGGKSGEFRWSDGVFLQALKAGHWVLLDELNLASQSVLEGLNACLDHRGEVFIPELGLVFKCPASFRVFACQNPLSQGGGRKGLPKSFLNRFTKVYVDALQENDYLFIARALHPSISNDLLEKMVRFNARLYEDTMVAHSYGHLGAPWEFNLRDILRWCELVEGMDKRWSHESLVETFLDVVYIQRLRTSEDRQHVLSLYEGVFGVAAVVDTHPLLRLTPEHLYVGKASLERRVGTQFQGDSVGHLVILPGVGNRLETLMHCVKRGWMCNLVGPVASGKTNLVRLLAAMTGNTLHEFALSSGTDTTELLGCFEQHDPFRRWQDIVRRVHQSLETICGYCLSVSDRKLPVKRRLDMVRTLLSSWAACQKCLKSRSRSANWASVNNEQDAVDPLAVDMLLQTLEQLSQVSSSCGVPSLSDCLQPEQLAESLKVVQESVGEVQRLGRFEWMDGGLLQAIEDGDWVLLENANFCNPTVLDRLNPLLEPDGTILINERGLVNGEAMLVRAHPNFRLFITVDPTYGEVSRAMRNRGVEIFMMEPNWCVPALRTSKYNLEASQNVTNHSAQKLLVQAGIPCPSLLKAMVKAHSDVKALTELHPGWTHISLRTLSHWISLLQQLLERGARYTWSMACSWVQTYVRHLENPQAREAALQIYESCLVNLDYVSGRDKQDVSLFVPGGWPSPQILIHYCMRSKESCVKIDSMLIEELVGAFISLNTTKGWNSLIRSSSDRGTHLSWLRAKADRVIYFPPRLLQVISYPLSSIDVDTGANFDDEELLRDAEIRLYHASLWMVEHGSISDIRLRTLLLTSIASKIEDLSHVLVNLAVVVEKELQHAVGKELLLAWKQLEGDIGGEFDSNLIPYAPQSNLFTYNGAQDLDNNEGTRSCRKQVLFLGRKLLSLRRSLLQWQTEDNAYKHVAMVGAGSLTSPVLQSYWHHANGPLRMAGLTTQVPKTVLKYLYPLFCSIRNLENDVLTGACDKLWDSVEAALSRLQDWHGAIWKISRQSGFITELFLFYWIQTKKALIELMELAADLSGIHKVAGAVRDIIQSLDASFNLGSGSGFKPLLWKHGGHPQMLNSKTLYDQELQILDFCRKNWETSNQDEADFFAGAQKDFRRVIMEGLSMTVWLRQRKTRENQGNHFAVLDEKHKTLTSMSMQEAQRESGEIFQMLLQRLESSKRIPPSPSTDVFPSLGDITLSGGDSEVSRLNGCKCPHGHRSDETVLADLLHLPSVRALWVELLPWFDQISFRKDMALLGSISAAISSISLESNLPQALRDGGLDVKAVEELLDFSLSSSSRSPLDFVPHQHILWVLEACSSKTTDKFVAIRDINHEMWFRWHQAIWRTSSKLTGESYEQWTMTGGPPRLFQAAQTFLLSNNLGMHPGPVKEYRERLLQLRRVTMHLWSLQKEKHLDAPKVDLCNLSGLFIQVFLAHEKSFELHDFLELRKLLILLQQRLLKVYPESGEMDGSKLMEELDTVLRRSRHQGLLSIAHSLVLPCAQVLYCTSWEKLNASETLLEHGRVWLLLGSVRLQLLLPIDECDPVIKHIYKQGHTQSQLHSLDLEIEVRTKSELYLRGSGNTKGILALESRAGELSEELTELNFKIIYRPQPSRFKDLCQEVKRFMDLSVGTVRLSALWAKLSARETNSDAGTGCIIEAVSLQENCEHFIKQIGQGFPAYRDFVQPLQQAVYELKYGLSLGMAAYLQRETIKSAGFQDADVTVAGLIYSLMEFPRFQSQAHELTIGGSSTVRPLSPSELVSDVTDQIVSWATSQGKSPYSYGEVARMEMRVKILRIALLRLGQEIHQSGRTSSAELEHLEVCFSSFSSLWGEIRDCQMERQRLEAEQSQYMTTTYNMDVEESMDEESFRKMFPDYKSDFGAFDDPQTYSAEEDDRRAQKASEAPMKKEDMHAEKAWTRMEESLIGDVISIHNQLFYPRNIVNNEQITSSEILEHQRVHTFVLSYDTGKQLLQTVGHCMPTSLDKRLLSSHLMRYNVEYHNLAGGAEAGRYMPKVNKLTETNASETALMLEPVANYLQRIEELLLEWPEHPILQQLSQISKTLLLFPLDTVVMKALTGVELLLAKSQLWEENAAKHVSIAAELGGLSRLVTHWRKMELEGWTSLLQRTEEKHVYNAQKLWFSLYAVLHRPVGDVLEAHLEATISSMEEFMQSATFGEFRTRLQLVQTFYGHISALRCVKNRTSSLSRMALDGISNLLYNLSKYYSQFLPLFDELLSSEKVLLEKELKDFVRLSKWDDRSYYTLALSSEKTHRKLHKFVKKYDDLLKRSVSEVVTKQAARMGTHNLSAISSSWKINEAVDVLHGKSVTNDKTAKKEPKDGGLIAEGLSADQWRRRCDSQMEDLSVMLAHISGAFTLQGAYQSRLPTLTSKIGSLLGGSLFINPSRTIRLEGARSLDMLATSVIVRSAELREGEKKLAFKKKALVDLLKVLRQIGLSHHKSAVPKEQRASQSWLLLHPSKVGSMFFYGPDVNTTPTPENNNTDTKLKDVCSGLWNKADDYYFNNMALIQHLQKSALDFNKDLSLREVDLSKGYMEHLLYMQQRQRVKAHDLSAKLGKIGQITQLLSGCGKTKAALPRQKFVRKWLWQQKSYFDNLEQVVAETLLLLKSSANVQLCTGNWVRLEVNSAKRSVEELVAGVQACKNRVDNHLLPNSDNDAVEKESTPIFCTSTMLAHVSMNFTFLDETKGFYRMLCPPEETPITTEISGLQPLTQVLFEGYEMSKAFELERSQSFKTADKGSTPNELLEELKNLNENMISEILLSVQILSKQESGTHMMKPKMGDPVSEEDTDVLGTIEEFENATLEHNINLRLDRVYRALLQVLVIAEKLVDHPSSGNDSHASLGSLLNCICIPLEMLHMAGMHLLLNYITFHKSVTKLGYVLSNLFVSLFTEGFCRTKEEEGEEGANNFEDDAKGTGMGEGEGKKDVSEQIEDEEQLMGDTGKDKEAQNDEGGKKLEKGIEMEQDFSADMVDLSEDEQEEDDTEEDEQEKLESKMGEDGENNEIVDEKLWNKDDEDDQQPESKEKYEQDSAVSGAQPEDLEMRGKEGTDEEETDKADPSKDKAGPKSETKDDGGEDDVGEEEPQNKDETLEDSSGVNPTTEDIHELPENLDLDGDENGKAEGGEPEDTKDDDDTDNVPQEGSQDTSIPDVMDINDDTNGNPEGLEENDQNPVESGKDEEAEEENPSLKSEFEDEVQTGDAKDEDSDPMEARKDVDGPFQDEPMDESQLPPGEDVKNPPNTDSRTSGKPSEMTNVIAGLMGNTSQLDGEENELRDTGMEVSKQDRADSGAEQSALETIEGENRTASWSDPSSAAADRKDLEKPDINPYRSLGDALKQWKERVKVADRSDQPLELENEPLAGEGDAPDKDDSAAEYEFIINDEDPSTVQALGAATQEQLDDNVARSEQTEHNSSDEVMQEPEVEDLQQRVDEEPQRMQESQVVANNKKARVGIVEKATDEDKDSVLDIDIEKDIELLGLEDKLEPGKKFEDSLVSLQNSQIEANRNLSSNSSSDTWNEEEISRIRKELEIGLQQTGGSVAAARLIWQKYENLTGRLSQELAEQLRLILEPTLATKLEGDYRSGKRINMKKVIPYIASQFRKDKIWLRRTKANKRQYQVVLAIDDSRSMSESHCGHMALEALITICRAMSHVEIGQMAVASFGEKGNVRLLHDFDQAFSSEAGVNMVSRFSFSQDNTIADEPMVDLLHFLTGMLDIAARNAASPSGNLNLQQLVLIIADGRFHEKESLRRCVREATSRKQLLAFIVLDNPQESILDMQSVSFANGAPSFTKYLDSFPFPYYILLRDIEALPRTLADLLRQWFELTQRSSSG